MKIPLNVNPDRYFPTEDIDEQKSSNPHVHGHEKTNAPKPSAAEKLVPREPAEKPSAAVLKKYHGTKKLEPTSPAENQTAAKSSHAAVAKTSVKEHAAEIHEAEELTAEVNTVDDAPKKKDSEVTKKLYKHDLEFDVNGHVTLRCAHLMFYLLTNRLHDAQKLAVAYEKNLNCVKKPLQKVWDLYDRSVHEPRAKEMGVSVDEYLNMIGLESNDSKHFGSSSSSTGKK